MWILNDSVMGIIIDYISCFEMLNLCETKIYHSYYVQEEIQPNLNKFYAMCEIHDDEPGSSTTLLYELSHDQIVSNYFEKIEGVKNLLSICENKRFWHNIGGNDNETELRLIDQKYVIDKFINM